MSKRMKNEPSVEVFEVGEPESPKLTHSAVGTFKDEKTGYWKVALIEFNPETGAVGKIQVVPSNESDRENNRNLFRRTVVEKGIL